MVLIGMVIFLAIFAALVAVAYKGDEGSEDCRKDVPCQECGKCYNDHMGASFSRHSYVYPRDIHR